MLMEVMVLPLLAVLAGVVSFTSPCCLPLIPSYLSYVTALPVAELGVRQARAVTLRASLLFVGGFTLVFTALGASFAYIGSALLANVPLLVRVAGVGIIVMGLGTAGVIRMPWLYREWRPALGKGGRGRGSKAAFPLGMAFAAGWVPCIGPVLATIAIDPGHGGVHADRPLGRRSARPLLRRPRHPVRRLGSGIPTDARFGGLAAETRPSCRAGGRCPPRRGGRPFREWSLADLFHPPSARFRSAGMATNLTR